MKVFLVREYMDGTAWEDARRIVGADEHEVAEAFAKWQCHRDCESYNTYESGKFIEVRFYAANESDQAAATAEPVTESTLVTVSVSFEPHFRSRVGRRIKDCAHPRAAEAPVLVSTATHYTRKCPDCNELFSTPTIRFTVSGVK